MTFKITFRAYCGMRFDIASGVDRQTAIGVVKHLIKRAKEDGQPVSKIGHGEWEFETPEDAGMVSDSDGVLLVRRVS